MNSRRYAFLIPALILIVIGCTLTMLLIKKEATEVVSNSVLQSPSMATSSEEIIAQEVPMEPRVIIPVAWTQSTDFGQSVDLAQILVSDLRPYTEKALEITLSNWSQWHTEGEVVFDREAGKILFHPTETASDTPEGSEGSDAVLLSIYRTEPNLSKDEILKKIATSNMESALRNNDVEPQEIKQSIENLHAYCTATQSEGYEHYVFLENSKYRELPAVEQDPFGACPFGTLYYFFDDLVITKTSKQRQSGVSVDEMLLR